MTLKSSSRNSDEPFMTLKSSSGKANGAFKGLKDNFYEQSLVYIQIKRYFCRKMKHI